MSERLEGWLHTQGSGPRPHAARGADGSRAGRQDLRARPLHRVRLLRRGLRHGADARGLRRRRGPEQVARFRLDPRDTRTDDGLLRADRRRRRRVRLHVAARPATTSARRSCRCDADRVHAPQDGRASAGSSGAPSLSQTCGRGSTSPRGVPLPRFPQPTLPDPPRDELPRLRRRCSCAMRTTGLTGCAGSTCGRVADETIVLFSSPSTAPERPVAPAWRTPMTDHDSSSPAKASTMKLSWKALVPIAVAIAIAMHPGTRGARAARVVLLRHLRRRHRRPDAGAAARRRHRPDRRDAGHGALALGAVRAGGAREAGLQAGQRRADLGAVRLLQRHRVADLRRLHVRAGLRQDRASGGGSRWCWSRRWAGAR